MKRIVLFLTFLICFLLQNTVLSQISVFGVSPNLILVLVIIFSFFFEDFDGLIFGVFFGLMQDVCFGHAVGVTALVYFFTGLLMKVKVGVYRDNKIILFFMTTVCTFVYYACGWLLWELMLQPDINFVYVMQKVPVAIVLNYIFLLIVYYFARNRKGFTI